MICDARESSNDASPDHFCHHLECFPSIGTLSTGRGNAMSKESEREHNSSPGNVMYLPGYVCITCTYRCVVTVVGRGSLSASIWGESWRCCDAKDSFT